jgi:hypothetical protein
VGVQELRSVREAVRDINTDAVLYEVNADAGIPDEVFERITR